MPKRKPNEELFEDGNKTLRFVADFGFQRAVSACDRDIAFIFDDLAGGKFIPDDIYNVMLCSLVDIDGSEPTDAEKKVIVEDIINRYGLQQCRQLGWVLLSHAMLGEKKSSEITLKERVDALSQIFLGGPSISFKKVGLLWAGNCIVSTVLVCMIFRYLGPLIS